MLEITIPETRLFDEKTEKFTLLKPVKLQLEHSLISLKKWESKWHKPFLGKEEKTADEIIDYIRCMTVGNPDPSVYSRITPEIAEVIQKYITDDMTATWFSKNSLIGAQKSNSEVITNEIIYYWMISLNIPVEFQKWHLNQLLTLIKVVSIKNSPKKKMSRREEAQQRAALNAKRRAKYKSKG